MDFISCPLRNFVCLDYSGPLKIKGKDNVMFYLLYQEMELLNIVNSYMYAQLYGIESLSYLQDHFICYKRSESTEDIMHRDIILNNFYCECQLLLDSLWFIKDNAVTPYMASICSDKNINPRVLRRNIYYTSSDGKCDSAVFSIEEINEAMSWYSILEEFILKKESKSVDYSSNLINMSNHISFDIPSFQRALFYLDDARKSEFLPSKISSYISILECICAVKGENTQKVSERIAYLIGNDVEDRIQIYNDIKKIYNFRSDYVHGSQITAKNYLSLPEVSKRADEIVRRVLSKIFTEHKDLNYTNRREKSNPNSKSNEDVDRWFNELIFRKE